MTSQEPTAGLPYIEDMDEFDEFRRREHAKRRKMADKFAGKAR